MNILTEARRVLLVCLDNLGDLVLAGGLAEEISRLHPETTIGFWTKHYTAEAARFIPSVGLFHSSDPPWDRFPGQSRGSIRRFLKTLFEIRKESYEACVIVTPKWRTALALNLIRIPVRIGFTDRRTQYLLTHPKTRANASRPVLEEWGRLLSPLGSDCVQLRPFLRIPSELEASRQELRESLGEGPIVGLHPFAGKLDRCAAPSFWIRLARVLSERMKHRVLILGSQEETERLRTEWERKHANGTDRCLWLDQLGSGKISDLLLALSCVDLFVGHDSGPLHCAVALEIPSLGLYLPGDWPRCKPGGKGALRILRKKDPSELSLDETLVELRHLLPPAS